MGDTPELADRLRAFETAHAGARLTKLELLHERIDRYSVVSYQLSALFRDAAGNESARILAEWRGENSRADTDYWDEVHRWAERESAARGIPFEVLLSGD